MFKQIKNTFAPPSHTVLAQRELESAKRQLLEAQSAQEYARAMCAYHEDRILRLTTLLGCEFNEVCNGRT